MPRPEIELDAALRELELSNPSKLKGVLSNLEPLKGLRPREIATLINHFDQVSLRDDDLEFSDVVGRAYDDFIGRTVEMSRKRGGEFFTPRSIAELMVRLVSPEARQSVYDPFAGSGGLLIKAREYVAEHGGNEEDTRLFGQEVDLGTWAISRINLLLHGVADNSLLHGDTLTDPGYVMVDGGLLNFDRVLANLPLGASYAKDQVRHPERMRYGWTSEHGRADLMNIQHILAVLRPDGIGAVLTAQGVLFRGAAEAEIRRGIVEDGRLEAVISLGSGILQYTSIPTCILVLRGANGLPQGRQGKVIFINAEKEISTGRAQNRLEPEAAQKIVEVYRELPDIPGFARTVPLQEIAANDFNLSVRRYVDTDLPPAMPPDARAIITGGVPIKEVEAQAGRFKVFGITVYDLFEVKDLGYLKFPSDGCEAISARIPDLAAAREREFADLCWNWWAETESWIAEFAAERRVLKSRSWLIESFSTKLSSMEILDRYQLSGAFAAWWSGWHDDLRILDHAGFQALIGRWTTASIEQYLDNPKGAARERLFRRLGSDLCSRTQSLVAVERQKLVDTYRAWADRYGISLVDLETQREATAIRLRSRLRELGYSD